MSSQYHLQFFSAATEAAIYAELWLRVRNGNHEAGPHATLRELLFPPQYESPPAPPLEEEADATAVEDLILPFIKPTPTTPTNRRFAGPQNHPGNSWYFNHAKAKRTYPLYTYRHGNLTRAQYIKYHKEGCHPKIEGTMGRGQPTFEAQLRAHDKNKGFPVLTPPQIRIFDSDTMGRMEVDRALKTIDDWPLTAEVQHYRTFVAELEEQHDQATRLRQKIADTMAQIHGSVYRLSQNNVYQRIQTVLQREDDPILWLANSELRAEMQYARELPESAPQYNNVCRCAHSVRSSATTEITASARTPTAIKTASYHADTVDTRDPAACAPCPMKPLAKRTSVERGDAKSDSNAARIAALDAKGGGDVTLSTTFSFILSCDPTC
ncbi:hypothetical protein EDB89DRAFT_2080455 [Lactarius sanguifluus]|nr:hypothetical protein EDB89DRAFT_2080455 [Lactarius sanguifluus]